MISDVGVERGLASVDELRIAFESAGTGTPAVLLIHGFFADRGYFTAQRDHLARSRRVVAIDLRGHGESDSPDVVAVDDFAADVIAVAEAAGVESAVLCGHSMGGAVALRVAAAHPRLVRGVVMLDSAVLFPEPVRQLGLQNLVPALATDHWLEALKGYFGRTLDPSDPPEVVARVMSALGRTRPEFARTFFSSLFASDFADALTAAHCPLMYVHAKAPTDLMRLAELRPDAMVGQVVGSGHWMMLSVPDQVNAMLDRFLELVVGPALAS